MSAPDVNQVVLAGRRMKDPDAKTLPDGSVCNLRLAVSDQRDRPPLIVDVATFGKQADTCGQYFTKGRQVAVAGRLVLDERESKAGHTCSKHRVIGNVSFGHDRNDAEGEDRCDE